MELVTCTTVILWVEICTIITCLIAVIKGDEGTDPSEYKHRGDLHIQRGSEVYSLAWVVEIRDECTLRDVIGNVKAKNRFTSLTLGSRMNNNVRSRYTTPYSTHEDDNFTNRRKCSFDMLLHLILIKKLPNFKNTYVVAHPYYKTYSWEKRYWSKRERRRHQNTYSVFTETDGKPGGNSRYSRSSDVFLTLETCLNSYFKRHSCVVYAKQEILRSRQKRGMEFNDPFYQQQWHLNNSAKGHYDLNVVNAWKRGITGRGINVCVIDDGLEWQHADLRNNYNPAGSYDINSDDPDPSPTRNGVRNDHGTRCAGEIAAVANNLCGVGVAFRAGISGIRVLGGRMTDSMEAAAFIHALDINDIYSCSWGPDDDGKAVDGPHHLARSALVHGITYGRKGYGAIYVVASGNGGKTKDNCNFDGYANSIYTITIGAVDVKGEIPYYAEECAAMLAVAPSSDTLGHDIVTTDWSVTNPSGCTKHHSGSSASAPLAAAVVALALEVQPCLSWRDVQHLVALTSRKTDVDNPIWTTNSAGLHHSHQHGFGLIDASAMVSAAAVWESVPFFTSYSSQLMIVNLQMSTGRRGKAVTHIFVDAESLLRSSLRSLEFVQVRVTIAHECRGSLKIMLICPSGTKSILAAPRDADKSAEGFKDWPFSTVRCWGENPVGLYALIVSHKHHQNLSGTLSSWQLVLHGSSMTTHEFQERRRLVRIAIQDEAVMVNSSHLCRPPQSHFIPFYAIPRSWVKGYVITGFVFMLLAVFNSIEYLFCYFAQKNILSTKPQDLSDGTINYKEGITI